jgi:hypothetical protein
MVLILERERIPRIASYSLCCNAENAIESGFAPKFAWRKAKTMIHSLAFFPMLQLIAAKHFARLKRN